MGKGVRQPGWARLPNIPALLPVGRESNEPHVVRYWKYKPYMVHLRERLAIFVRRQRGDTPQRRFARRIGVAQSTIMRIENQEQNVTLDTLEQLCKAFHVDVGGLFAENIGRKPATQYATRSGTQLGDLAQPAVHEPESAGQAVKASVGKSSDKSPGKGRGKSAAGAGRQAKSKAVSASRKLIR